MLRPTLIGDNPMTDATPTVSQLLRRMIDDMTLRNLSLAI